MKLVKDVHDTIWSEYKSYSEVYYFINKWHVVYDEWGNENFHIHIKPNSGNIDLEPTLHGMDGDILLKIAIEMGVDTRLYSFNTNIQKYN